MPFNIWDNTVKTEMYIYLATVSVFNFRYLTTVYEEVHLVLANSTVYSEWKVLQADDTCYNMNTLI